MTTTLTVMSLTQGTLKPQPRSEEEYWASHQVEPQHDDLPFWHRIKIAWPFWPLRFRADHD